MIKYMFILYILYVKQDNERMADKTTDWEIFANTLGYRELARLDKHDVKYRVPVPGARSEIIFILSSDK